MLRLSTGARNGIVGGRGLQQMFNKGYIEVYTGTQPLTADLTNASYTKLGLFTLASGALTKETRATGTITVTAAASGTINSVSVGGLNIIPDGAVTADGTTTGTAQLLCDAINRNGLFEASVSGAVVTIRGNPGSGAITPAITNSLTTVTTTLGTPMSGGVAPVNGLMFGAEALGVLSKLTSQVWSCAGLAAGTAGWFRLFSSDTADTGGTLSGAPWYPRIDGSVGVGSGDLQLSTLAFTVSGPVTIDGFQFTMPAQ